jgi:hypothetical protein
VGDISNSISHIEPLQYMHKAWLEVAWQWLVFTTGTGTGRKSHTAPVPAAAAGVWLRVHTVPVFLRACTVHRTFGNTTRVSATCADSHISLLTFFIFCSLLLHVHYKYIIIATQCTFRYAALPFFVAAWFVKVQDCSRVHATHKMSTGCSFCVSRAREKRDVGIQWQHSVHIGTLCCHFCNWSGVIWDCSRARDTHKRAHYVLVLCVPCKGRFEYYNDNTAHQRCAVLSIFVTAPDTLSRATAAGGR